MEDNDSFHLRGRSVGIFLLLIKSVHCLEKRE